MRKPITHRHLYFSLFAVVCSCVLSASCGKTLAAPPPAPPTLLAVAKAYGATTGASKPAPQVELQKPDPRDTDETGYENDLTLALYEHNFDLLEKEADDARTRKTRFSGGVWKISDFYEAFYQPPSKDKATEADWTALFAALKAWQAARPDSVTPRIALAYAYAEYGFFARGDGYASTVNNSSWSLFNDRIGQAASTLVDAAKLKDKDPQWFEVMQVVALSQGWKKDDARELFESAYAFEPLNYAYARRYANYLLPKWYGDPGDAEAFGQEIADRVGGEQGDYLYFQVASVVACQCGAVQGELSRMSWPRIRKGYAALNDLYGDSALAENRYAIMAYETSDKPTALEAFAQIGDNWDKDVWQDRVYFDRASNWAKQ